MIFLRLCIRQKLFFHTPLRLASAIKGEHKQGGYSLPTRCAFTGSLKRVGINVRLTGSGVAYNK